MASWFGALAAPWNFGGAGSTAEAQGGADKVAALSTQPQLAPGSALLASSSQGGQAAFQPGDIVEYNSASQGAWIPAKILSITSQGNFNLDCKPDVPRSKIRELQRKPDAPARHSVGEAVEYLSTSQGGWIPATVVSVGQEGSYDLDCKPSVSADRIRSAASRPSALVSAPTLPLPSGPFTPSARSAGAAAELTAPVQLLRVRRAGGNWSYEVCPEGAAALERHGSRRIAVVAVCGLYRSGKSFLLNVLLERTKRGLPPFTVGSTTQACTQGLWLWGSADAEDDQSPLLAFIDCEGFGSTDSDRNRDAQLLTLCALLSSVLVLNTKGALNEGLFNSLALACRFAEHVEERGNEASRPALLWVLRDFALELRDPAGHPISPEEYLERALHAGPSPGVGAERGQAARDVRRSLLGFFSHRGCATLVQPAVEEEQLQKLDQLPYTALRSEFRAGAEALRTRLLAACRVAPKAVAGQPIGCCAFVGLLRRLAEALSAGRALSVRGAWEAVQHSACGELADELRGGAARTMRTLAAGQEIPGGAKLPMGEDALRAVLRDQRHLLKAQWEDRAIGDEAVRREYWQELKEGLAREEQAVKQSNARLADQSFAETLRSWQEWLDNDAGEAAKGDRLANDMGQLLERMPLAPLSRAGRAAIEAAACRVAVARAAVVATLERSAEAQRRAVAFGEQAAQQEGAARSELGSARDAAQAVREELRQLQHAEHAAGLELQAQEVELQDAKEQLAGALQDAEEARAREAEHRAAQRAQGEREASLQAELEDARGAAVRAEAEHAASERGAQEAAGAGTAEAERLQAEVAAAREEAARLADQLASERAVLGGENERARSEQARAVEDAKKQLDAERGAMKGEQERARAEHERLATEARRQLEEERSRHGDLIAAEQGRLMEQERSAGILEGRVAALSGERASLRDRVEELRVRAREAELQAGRQAQDGERLAADLARASRATQQARTEVEKKMREQKRDFEARLNEERLKLRQVRPGCGPMLAKRTGAPAKA